MRVYVALFMPVIWALVSAGLALLLYKTSQAAFIGHVGNDDKRKQLGLVGSVVIFAVIFAGLAHYSPASLITDLRAGRATVLLQELEAMDRSLSGLEGACDELNACLQVSPIAECRQQWTEVQARVSQARIANARVHQSAE